MSDFDKDLGAALSADDKAFLEDIENGRGLFDQLGATLHGPMRFWSYLITATTFFVFLAAVYSGWQAYVATNIRDTILWVAALIILFMMVGFSKNWLFQRMNLLSILGELKKIELRLAQLGDRN